MVTMHRSGNWKIAVYCEPGHALPHFHIEGRGFRCSISIETRELIIGDVPRAVLRAAIAWSVANETVLMTTWQELNDGN